MTKVNIYKFFIRPYSYVKFSKEAEIKKAKQILLFYIVKYFILANKLDI